MSERIFKIPSTTPVSECLIIEELINTFPACSKIVEIGTGPGRVTAMIAHALGGKGSVLYTVDDYSEANRYGEKEKYGGWSHTNAEKALTDLGLNGHVKFIVKTSVRAGMDFENSSVDLVYLDGGHTYRAVCKDIDIWYPKIKKGGIIAGHDFDPNCSDGRNVMKAICDKLLKNPNREMVVKERVWWINK